jgi:hypothetical protein
MFYRPFLLVVLLGWCTLPARVRAQEQGRGYVPIPYQGNLEEMLRRQLSQTRVEKLLKQFHIDLEKINIDPKSLPLEKILGQKKNNFQEMLKKLPLDKLPPVEKKKVQENAQEIDKVLQEMRSRTEKSPPSLPETKPAPAPEENLENRFGRWARDLMEQAKNSDLGEMFRESSAWQEGLEDFKHFLSQQDVNVDRWGLGKLLPKDLKIDLGQGWANFKGLSLPGLPSVKFPMPNLGISNPLPGLGLPSLPSGSLAISQAALWILVALGLVLVLWQMARRVGRPGQVGPGWRPGPWPVDPARISSRADLIAAFDHLALLCLGQQARTWNHQTIGNGLGTDPERRRAALELASLYEWARYAPEADALSDQALASARHDLCFLAGGAAS